MKRYLGLIPPALALVLAFVLNQSGTREDYFIVGTDAQKSELGRLFWLLNQEKAPGAPRYSLLHEIVARLKAQGQTAKINLFLTTYVAQNPTDPFNSHYLFEVAENYRELGALTLAAHYYQRIVKNYPDLVESGDSIHYQCLNWLVQLDTDPSIRKKDFEELQARFKFKMASAPLYYSLGKTYESLGLWNEAMAAYANFLNFPDTTVVGDPRAYQRVRSLVDFSKVDRLWVRQDLTDLIGDLKRAILNADTGLMESLRAKVGFFALSWDNIDLTDSLSEAFDIREFLRGLVREASYGASSSVQFKAALDEDSSESEAFLQSTGWTYRIPTWYFYFRRVSYPADPEINGAWEWAGIFFGEKL